MMCLNKCLCVYYYVCRHVHIYVYGCAWVCVYKVHVYRCMDEFICLGVNECVYVCVGIRQCVSVYKCADVCVCLSACRYVSGCGWVCEEDAHGYMNVCLHQAYLHECGYGVYIMCVLDTDMYMCVCVFIYLDISSQAFMFLYACGG